MVCLTPNEDTNIDFIKVRSFGIRLLGIALMFPFGLREQLTRNHDVIVACSLFPYGIYALAIGAFTQTPTHLVILGADLDRHAEAWYGLLPRTAFRRFDSISVLGSAHRTQLEEYGVDSTSIFELTNAIDTSRFAPEGVSDVPDYDFVWAGRFSSEKDPVAFVDALAELQSRGHNVDAVMLGDGDLMPSIKAHVEMYELDDVLRLPGWVDDTAQYYGRSATFVLTSRREALGLSLLESMAMGLACVAPKVGNIPDVAVDEENALLVNRHSPIEYADAMERTLLDDELRAKLGRNAISTGQAFSYARAREDWEEIVSYTVQT